MLGGMGCYDNFNEVEFLEQFGTTGYPSIPKLCFATQVFGLPAVFLGRANTPAPAVQCDIKLYFQPAGNSLNPFNHTYIETIETPKWRSSAGAIFRSRASTEKHGPVHWKSDSNHEQSNMVEPT
jgi:hypothetical protein